MKNYSKKRKLSSVVLKVLLSIAFIFTIASCDQLAGTGFKNPDSNPPAEPQTVEQKILGTWAYDYGYNQDEFSNEELTFNADKTFVARFGESDYESGTYKIVNDKVHGLSIEWHFTEYGDKNEKKSSDVTSLYKCTFDDDDTVHLDRFSRDRTKIGGMVETFDPPRENTYYRIKNGTKETLTSGKWNVIKNSSYWNNYDCSWEFTTDGNMVDYWTDNGIKNEFHGQYEIVQENGKEFLYQKIFMGSETYYEEFWYNFKKLGPNLIHVIAEKHTTCGVEDTNDGNMYFYREVETETINYHLGLGTYKHMVPKADSYTLINHPWQLEAINNHFSSYEFLGWYDNPDFTGTPVTTVSGNTRDFYAKYNLTTQYETWKNDDGSTGADYYTSLPASVVLNDEKDFQKPKRGENISILFEATLAEDINGLTGLNFMNWDYADNVWKVFGYDRRNIKTTGKKIKEVFNFTVPDKDIPFTDYYDDYCLVFYYNAEGDNKANTFSDWKFTILDDTDSYKITYKFGDVSYVARGLKDSDFELAKSESNFSHLDWRFDNFELLGWYDNPELTGTPVTSVPAGNTAEKTYYAKFNLRIRGKNMFDDGKNYNYPIDVPLKSVLSGVSFNPKPGDTISIYFEATFKNDLDGWASVGIVDATNGGWRSIAGDGRDIKTTNKKMKEVFSMKINSNETLPTDINNYGFNFCYNPDACDDTNIISDWKIVLLDETNSYNIAYKWGDVEYRTKGYKEIDFALPENAAFFDNFDWRIAQQELLGWYDNPELTGTPVTSIPKGNTSDKTYYAKFNFKGRYCEWEDNGVKQHDYHTTVPVRTLLSETKFNPKSGDTYNILFEATLSHDFNQWAGLQLQTNDGKYFQDFGNLETQNKKLSKVFTIKIPDNVKLPSVDELYFDFWYSDEACDEIVTFSDWRFVLLDETNSYSIIYHFGNIEYEEKQLTAIKKTLPDDMLYFEKIDWNIGNNLLFGGWYDNPECTGASLSTISANSIAAGGTKDVYLNLIPKMNTWTSDTDDGFNYNTTLPAKLFLSESSLNSIKNMTDTIFVYLTATVKDSPILHENGWSWFTFIDSTDWSDVANTDSKQVSYSNGKINITYKLNKIDGKKLPDPEKMIFGMGFNDDFYGDRTKPIELYDIKIVILDDSNS